jgi:gamma-glutamyltranspeptidase
LTLRILEGFDLAKMKRNSADHVDTVLRAIRLAAGVRIATGVPSAQKLAEILSDSHVEGCASACATANRSSVRPAMDASGDEDPINGATPHRSRSPIATAMSSA